MKSSSFLRLPFIQVLFGWGMILVLAGLLGYKSYHRQLQKQCCTSQCSAQQSKEGKKEAGLNAQSDFQVCFVAQCVAVEYNSPQGGMEWGVFGLFHLAQGLGEAFALSLGEDCLDSSRAPPQKNYLI